MSRDEASKVGKQPSLTCCRPHDLFAAAAEADVFVDREGRHLAPVDLDSVRAPNLRRWREDLSPGANLGKLAKQP
jgi:hypothetical protein